MASQGHQFAILGLREEKYLIIPTKENPIPLRVKHEKNHMGEDQDGSEKKNIGGEGGVIWLRTGQIISMACLQ